LLVGICAEVLRKSPEFVTYARLTAFHGLGRISRSYDLSAALGWGFFAGIWGSGKCQLQNGRAADFFLSRRSRFAIIRSVNRRRRIFTVLACGLAALLLLAMFSTRPKNSVPISAINSLNAALLQDGFTNDQTVMSVDEIALAGVPGAKAIVSTFYPDYRKQRVNRSYLKDGAKLGIDYTLRRDQAVEISLPADAAHCARARKMARELAELNPNLSIWLRTNDPPIATKR
jgi:hypothetical protein